jgi:CRP/FNR family transcriptional regulator, cyclic AMP receptor protein
MLFRIEHPDQLLYFISFPPDRRREEGLMGKAAKNGFNPKVFLAKVGTGKKISKSSKDQIIFAQGDAADTIFYLQNGKVKIVVLSDQGKEAVVGIIEPDQFFGEGCLNGQSLRIATATAMEPCLITSITKTAMMAVLQKEPKFSQMFMAHLLTRNNRVEADLIDQLFNSSEKRLARLLLLLANFAKEGSPGTHRCKFRSGDARGNDRHDAIPRQFLYEQIPKIGLHQLQRQHRGPPFAIECGLTGEAANRQG